MQNDSQIKRAKREVGQPESASGESDCESLLDEIEPSSPVAPNPDDKPLKLDAPASQAPLPTPSVTTVAPVTLASNPVVSTAIAAPPPPTSQPPLQPPPPPSLPVCGDLSRPTDNVVEIKTESGEPATAIFPTLASPSAELKKPTENVDEMVAVADGRLSDDKSGAESDKEKSDFGASSGAPFSKAFDFAATSNPCLKNENIYGPVADSKDEILPPVLTSGEENYVPKDEMPTLHASTNGMSEPGALDAPFSTCGYGSQMEMPMDAAIKMEPGLQTTNDDACPGLLDAVGAHKSSRGGESSPPPPTSRHSSSPSAFANLVSTTCSPPSSLAFTPTARLTSSESPKPSAYDSNASDRLANVPPNQSSAGILLPGAPFSMYQENERTDKCLIAPPASANLPPPSASLNLSGPHHGVGAAAASFPSYYHYSSPHPAHVSDRSEHSPYLGKRVVDLSLLFFLFFLYLFYSVWVHVGARIGVPQCLFAETHVPSHLSRVFFLFVASLCQRLSIPEKISLSFQAIPQSTRRESASWLL